MWYNTYIFATLLLLLLTARESNGQDFTLKQTAEGEANLPVLDFSKFLSDDQSERQEFVDKLRTTLTGPGFMYIKNHGIPEELSQKVLEETRPWFERSAEEKMKYASDNDLDLFDGYEPLRSTSIYGELNFQEGYSFNVSHLSETIDKCPFKDTQLEEYGTMAWSFLITILRAYALAAGIDENYFSDRHELLEGTETMSNLRINYYPKIPPDMPIEPRFGAHSDFMTLSALYQRESGLEVWNQEFGRWEEVPPKPGCLVVNTGIMMQSWTNGLFPATVHRVRAYERTRNIARMVLVLFMGGRGEQMIDAGEVFPKEEIKWKAVTAHDLIDERMGAFRRGDKEKTKKGEEGFSNIDALHEHKLGSEADLRTEL